MSTKTLIKYISLGLCLLIIIIVTVIFMYFPPNGKLVCKLKSAPGDTYANYTYTINFKLWKATSFISEERLYSNDEDYLKSYSEELKESFKEKNQYEYFNNNLSLKDNELIIKTRIDYKLLKKYMKKEDNKPKLGIRFFKKAYTVIGANCKYK